MRTDYIYRHTHTHPVAARILHGSFLAWGQREKKRLNFELKTQFRVQKPNSTTSDFNVLNISFNTSPNILLKSIAIFFSFFCFKGKTIPKRLKKAGKQTSPSFRCECLQICRLLNFCDFFFENNFLLKQNANEATNNRYMYIGLQILGSELGVRRGFVALSQAGFRVSLPLGL